VSSYAAPTKENEPADAVECVRHSASEHKDHSADSSFLSDESCVESLSSDIRESTNMTTTSCNSSAMHGNNNDHPIDLPNVVNVDLQMQTKRDGEKRKSTAANDSFLANVVKEIERLDEELSSMGLLTADHSLAQTHSQSQSQSHSHSSTTSDEDDDDDHDEEEKMDTLLVQKHEEDQHAVIAAQETETTIDNSAAQRSTETDTSLDLLPSESVTIFEALDVDVDDHDTSQSCVEFASQREKDAYFDPLVSPPRRLECPQHDDKENIPTKPTKRTTTDVDNIPFDQAIQHESATKIQKQWKKFQFKSLLVRTFNRHLTQSIEDDSAVTVSDLLAATTHEIVEHAEKLFAAVHDDDEQRPSLDKRDTIKIGAFAYTQLHFCGSPALDWSAVYSMLESIVLRNVLYYQHSDIVKQILESQRLLNEIVASTTTTADEALTAQLVQQLTQLKTKLYQRCQHNMRCNLTELRLFPPNVHILRSKTSPSMIHSPMKSEPFVNVHNASYATPLRSLPIQPTVPASASATKPELDTIKHQLKLLRQSFSLRRRNKTSFRSSIHSSPKLCASLRSSIEDINGQIHELCSKRVLQSSIQQNHPPPQQQQQPEHISFTHDACDEQLSPATSTLWPARPSTAPHPYHHHLHQKKTYLKRRKQRNLVAHKVDWSHVKPKTVSRLSDDVRAHRVANSHRMRYKPNVVNFRERAFSKVDCNWPSAKSKTESSAKSRKAKKKSVGSTRSSAHSQNNHSNKFSDSYHHSNDNYLFYITKENKVGKISRDSAEAQLHRGRGSMILQANGTNNEQPHCSSSSRRRVTHDRYSDRDHQLTELQETFAQIQAAMKQKRLKQHE